MQEAEGKGEGEGESLLTFIAQYDPKGWVWDYGGYKLRLEQEVRKYIMIPAATICA